MAKDRIFLRCNTCGKAFMLAKDLGGGEWIFRQSSQEFGDLFANFIAEHGLCGDEQDPRLAGRKHQFDLVYESDDDEYYILE